jgi:hypothetical protein
VVAARVNKKFRHGINFEFEFITNRDRGKYLNIRVKYGGVLSMKAE